MTRPHARPAAGPRRPWTWKVALATVLAGLCAGWLVSGVPGGEYGRRMLTRAALPFLMPIYSEAGRASITVLTIDDADLSALDLAWPLPLEVYARQIERLLDLDPDPLDEAPERRRAQASAIFLDLVFLAEQSDRQLAAFHRALCKATQQGVPVFVASLGPGHEPSRVERSVLYDPANPCRAIPVGVEIRPDRHDQAQWIYPMHGGDAQALPSAALAIACRVGLIDRDRCAAPDGSMALVWATDSAWINRQTMVANGSLEPICSEAQHWWESVGVLKTLHGLFVGESPQYKPCPYHPVIPLRAFAPGQGFSHGELVDAFDGKVVMIGADIAAASDTVISPVHGRIPGVHVHAMALDNLYAYREGYLLAAEPTWNAAGEPANLFRIVSVVLLTLGMTFWELRVRPALTPDGRGHPPRWQSWLSFAIDVFNAVLKGKRGSGPDPGKWRLDAAHAGWNFAMFLLLFAIGYGMLRQGPLTVMKYWAFPLLMQFFDVGRNIVYDLPGAWKAAGAPDPWRAWTEGDTPPRRGLHNPLWPQEHPERAWRLRRALIHALRRKDAGGVPAGGNDATPPPVRRARRSEDYRPSGYPAPNALRRRDAVARARGRATKPGARR